jgi:hypothetical protein
MRHLVLGVLLAASAAASGALGCSSSSSSQGSGDDGGGAQDGTSSGHEGGSGNEGGPDSSRPGNDAASDSGTAQDSAMTGDTGSGFDSGTIVDSGTGVDTGMPVDAGCGSVPSLHPDPAGTIFCGFGADGGSLSCQTGQECCLGGSLGGGTFGPQECATYGSTCTNGGDPDAGGSLAIPIACLQIADCTANGVASAGACCLQGATAPADQPGCTYPRSKSGSAIVCETAPACAVGEVQICSSQADCPTGTTCTPGKWKIFQVGFCL